MAKKLKIPVDTVRAMVKLLEYGQFESGVCMCGDEVVNHGHGISNHAPVDELGYHAAELRQELLKCLNPA